MAAFNRSATPILPTRQIYTAKQTFEEYNVTLEFFVFAHMESDILELVVFNCDTDIEFEHMILSKKAVLAQVDEELVARFELARLNRRDNDASEESLLDECTNEMIGEFVVDRVSIDPKDMNRLLLAPTSNRSGAPMPILALKPRGRSDLNFNRESNEEEMSSGNSVTDAMLPTSAASSSQSPGTAARLIRRPSLVLKAVDAFKQSVVHKEKHDLRRADMHPAKGRLHRSVKRVMLQNAVEKMRQMLGRPPSEELEPEGPRSRPNSVASTGRESPKKVSQLESTREAIEARKQAHYS